MIKTVCARCGKEIQIYPCNIKPHNFCSRECLADYSNKIKNPYGYGNLKNYEKMSKHMTVLNRQLNPDRMTLLTRMKLSAARRGTGQGKTYAKFLGRHTHRIVAEKMLGRKLLPGETVHHIDRNKRNNNPKNLIVFRSQAEHAKWHIEHDKKEGDANEVHST